MNMHARGKVRKSSKVVFGPTTINMTNTILVVSVRLYVSGLPPTSSHPVLNVSTRSGSGSGGGDGGASGDEIAQRGWYRHRGGGGGAWWPCNG